MTAPNVTPSADNLLLGTGEVWFNRFDANGDPTGLRHLGNVETLEITTTDDVLEKFSSMQAGRPLYKRVTRRRTVNLRAAVDEFVADNIAIALMGEAVVTAAQAATAVVDEPVAAATVPGTYFKTAKLGPITSVSVEFGATPGVLGTDYEIYDPDVGIIYILPDTALTGAVTVSYTPTAYADGLTQIKGGTKNLIEGSLLFRGNTDQGPRYLLEVWKVSAGPDGALGLISEEFAQMGLNFGVQADKVGHPDNPLYSLIQLP